MALGVQNSAPDEPIAAFPIDITGGRVLGLAGPSPRSQAYWDAVVQQAEDTTVLLVWNGNQHLSKFLFATEKPFDFYVAGYPELAIYPVDLIPETQVRDYLARGNGGLKPLLNRLANVPGCEAIVLGTPPPKGNDALVRTFVSREMHFVQIARKMGVSVETIPFTDRLIRWKLWLVIQDLLKETAEAQGCRFLPVPETVMDSEGFLKEELWREDATHANLEYGRVFWDSTLSKVGAS
jgi:hypothetical protein